MNGDKEQRRMRGARGGKVSNISANVAVSHGKSVSFSVSVGVNSRSNTSDSSSVGMRVCSWNWHDN